MRLILFGGGLLGLLVVGLCLATWWGIRMEDRERDRLLYGSPDRLD